MPSRSRRQPHRARTGFGGEYIRCDPLTLPAEHSGRFNSNREPLMTRTEKEKMLAGELYDAAVPELRRS
jgi:hypothetical protein